MPVTLIRAPLAAVAFALAPLASASQGHDIEAPAACQDFYGHVNATWLAQTDLPASRSRIGSFDELARRNEAVLQRALRDLSSTRARAPGLNHAAKVWASALDEDALERRGVQALQPLLDQIAALRTRAQLPAIMAKLTRAQVAAPIAIGVRPDPMDTRRYTLMLSQSGLTLPDRNDALGSDPTALRMREAAQRYRAALLKAWQGQTPSVERLSAIEGLEKRLAEASTPRAQLRDPRASYHPHLTSSLAAQAPGLDWAALIQALNLPERAPARFVVGQPEFMRAVAREAAQTDLAVWRDYLALRLLDQYSAGLSKPFHEAHFEYHGKAQRGQQVPAPRQERMVEVIGGRTGGSPLGQLFGQVFVQAAFPAEAAQRSAELVDDIKEAMRARVRGLPWMSEATKLKALAKLDAMSLKIGAPARWPDYRGLVTRPDDLAGNLLRGAQWASAQRFEDLGRPVDRSRWNTSPHIVNAFAGGLNEIIFPAGILQAPFFDAKADDASNFGGIGMVIGHEIIHHFDDRGRQFDALGNLSDWWMPEDAAAYRERASKVSALYSGIEALPGHRINGDLTLGENISDLGGLQIAYDGLQRALARRSAAPRADGRTPSQAFFVNQAVVWRSKYRTEAMIQQLRTDSHSPPRYRVLTPMAHTEAFQKAFQCQPGDAMVAEPRLTIW
jgi:predicted metalloendopeptidase